jgi:hypothetical protein
MLATPESSCEAKKVVLDGFNKTLGDDAGEGMIGARRENVRTRVGWEPMKGKKASVDIMIEHRRNLVAPSASYTISW